MKSQEGGIDPPERQRDFRRLWAAQAVSVFGSLVSNTALPFAAVLVLKATPGQMALLGVANLVPGVLFSLFAGAWADRLRRRPLMIAMDIGRALLLVSIPVAALLGALSMQHLYMVAFFTGLLTMVFDVAHAAYLPSLVSRERLLDANSRLSATASAAEIGAFGIVGWLVQIFSAPVAVLIDALTFLFSAASLATIRTKEPPPSVPVERPDMRREIVEGLRTIGGQPVLKAITAATLTQEFSVRIFGTVFLLFTARELGFSPGVLGSIFAVGGAASLLGAVAAPRLVRRFGTGPAMVGALFVSGVGMLLIPMAGAATLVGASFLIGQQLVCDPAFTVYDINQTALRQTLAPDHLLGRVNATIRLSGLFAMLAGALVAGALGEVLGLRLTLVLGAAGVMLTAVGLALSPLWRVQKAELPDALTAVSGGE